MVRLSIIVLEAVHVTKEALNTDAKPMPINTADDEEGIPLLGNHAPESPETLLPTLAIVGTGLGLAGSILQVYLYKSARKYSKEVHDYLQEHNQSRVGILSLHTIHSMHLWCP